MCYAALNIAMVNSRDTHAYTITDSTHLGPMFVVCYQLSWPSLRVVTIEEKVLTIIHMISRAQKQWSRQCWIKTPNTTCQHEKCLRQRTSRERKSAVKMIPARSSAKEHQRRRTTCIPDRYLWHRVSLLTECKLNANRLDVLRSKCRSVRRRQYYCRIFIKSGRGLCLIGPARR